MNDQFENQDEILKELERPWTQDEVLKDLEERFLDVLKLRGQPIPRKPVLQLLLKNFLEV